MIIAFFLKTLCDISYYMCFASLIGSIFGIQDFLLPYVLLLSLCAAFSMALDSRTKQPALRIAPIGLCAAGILLAADIPTFLVLLPAILYTAFICSKRYFYPDHYHYVASFKTLIALLGLMAAIVVLFGKSGVLQSYAVPFILLYILGSVLLMRMLRHSERTMRQPAFILMNTASIAGVCLLSIFMSTSTGLNAMKALFLAAYNIIMVLYVYVIGPIIGVILWSLIKLLSIIPTNRPPKELDEITDELIGKQQETHLNLHSLRETIYIVLAVCLAALLIYIFKTLLNKAKPKEKKNGSSSYYEYIKPATKKQLSFSAHLPSTPAGQVRLYYKKMLMFFIKHGLSITKYMDTSEIEAYACRFKPEKKDLIKKMRLIYQPARYGKGVSKQAAAEAKSLYHEIKKASK